MSEPVHVGVDLFAGAGGLSLGQVKAIVAIHRETIADATGPDPTEVNYDHPTVHDWLEDNVEFHAINHWEPAIETHERNHPWANHYHAKIQELHPPNVVEPGTVDILTGGPSCTHFSRARGGKPVSEQKRASAWDVLNWVEALRPTHLLLENVPEFRDWAPIVDGQPTRDGSIFERWVGMLEALGYSVVYDEADEEYGVELNAADYGEAQSRKRLFIMASRETRPTKPEPTHDDADPAKPDRRTAADIIDWSDLGTSLWTRDIEHARVQPLGTKTMSRIAEGIRRHCDPRLEPLADALEDLGNSRDRKNDRDVTLLDELRETIVPARYAPIVAEAIDRPFLVRKAGDVALAPPAPESFILGQHSNSIARDVEKRPTSTVAKGGNIHLCNPETFLLGQHGGATARNPNERPLSTVAKDGAISMTTVETQTLVKPRNGPRRGIHSNPPYRPDERPLHTVTAKNHDGHLVTSNLVHYSHGGRIKSIDDQMPTVATEKGGAFGLANSFLCPLYNGRSGQRPRTRRVDRPLMTVTASKGAPACLATADPFLVEYYGNSDARATTRPLGTVTKKDRFALCVPAAWPWGLDVKYRMLEPRELQQAQGFPEAYDIAGSSKKTVTAQIGNAVPVHLARALCLHLLADETPSLSTYGGGIQADPDASVPAYEEVLPSDD